jgi:hypothetical protein
MRIVTGRPPNYAAIAAAFQITGRSGLLFAYGDTIYNQDGIRIPPCLIEHERVHLARQCGIPEAWWERYIADPAFRLAEEIPAHRAEWITFCQGPTTRKLRRAAFAMIAGRLSSPIYGSLISVAKAREVIGG